MQTQIQSYLTSQSGGEAVKIFGYSTKSVPGLEIIGLGKYGKIIKEKIYYITKKRKIKLPVKRFVICIEQSFEMNKLKKEEVKWLEFPILILFWYLIGIIPIKYLDDCFCMGAIETTGKIIHREISPELQETLINILDQNEMKHISIDSKSIDFLPLINSDGLLGHIEELNFC